MSRRCGGGRAVLVLTLLLGLVLMRFLVQEVLKSLMAGHGNLSSIW